MSEVILNNDNFKEEVLDSKVPVLVDFWAPWCGPCQMMGPIVEEVANELKDKEVKVSKINVDEGQEVAQKYGVVSIPTFKIFKGGEIVDEFMGATTKEDIISRLEKFI